MSKVDYYDENGSKLFTTDSELGIDLHHEEIPLAMLHKFNVNAFDIVQSLENNNTKEASVMSFLLSIFIDYCYSRLMEHPVYARSSEVTQSLNFTGVLSEEPGDLNFPRQINLLLNEKLKDLLVTIKAMKDAKDFGPTMQNSVAQLYTIRMAFYIFHRHYNRPEFAPIKDEEAEKIKNHIKRQDATLDDNSFTHLFYQLLLHLCDRLG